MLRFQFLIAGQKVIHLKSPKHPEGNHAFTWNGKKRSRNPFQVFIFSSSASKRIQKVGLSQMIKISLGLKLLILIWLI